jgi:hypothetical protein
MWGVDKKDLAPIHAVAQRLYSDYNPEKLGAWGILFLCCGALATQNSSWRIRIQNSEILVCPSDLDRFAVGSDVCTSDDYAVRFSEFIKKWSNESYAVSVIEKRTENLRKEMSDKAYLNYKTYLTLAFMLTSLKDLARDKILGFDCQTWLSTSTTKQHHYGWPELFFAAGILLNNDESVALSKMASAIHAIGKYNRIDVTDLFEHYAGRNVFSSIKSPKIQVTQLKKGARIRLRSGWEAIVVEECDGNTLIAKVFGDFTETGSIYAMDVVSTEVDGKWIEVEMNEEQKCFEAEIRPFFHTSEAPNQARKPINHPETLKSIREEERLSFQKALKNFPVPKPPQEVTSPPTAEEYDAGNKFFTKDKADKPREIKRKKLSGIHMGMPPDPEIFQAGIDLAGYHIEAGACTFDAYARKMIRDLGDAVRPYLKSFYMAIRNYPGFDKTGMNTETELDAIDENAIEILEKIDKLKTEGGC